MYPLQQGGVLSSLLTGAEVSGLLKGEPGPGGPSSQASERFQKAGEKAGQCECCPAANWHSPRLDLNDYPSRTLRAVSYAS